MIQYDCAKRYPPTAGQAGHTERNCIMTEKIKWMLIDLLIRHRVLAPCYVRSDRRYSRRYMR